MSGPLGSQFLTAEKDQANVSYATLNTTLSIEYMSHMSMFFDSVNNGLTISIDSSSIVMMGKKIGHHNQRNYLLIETHQDLETRNIPTQHSSSRGPSYSSSALYFWAVTGEGKWMTIICNMASPAGSHFLITVCRSQVNKQKLTSQSAVLLTLSNNLNIILGIYLKMYYISSKICVLMTQYAKSTHTHTFSKGFPSSSLSSKVSLTPSFSTSATASSLVFVMQ